jgi:hypothetical protein
MVKDVMKKFGQSKNAFQDAPEDDRYFLQTFSLISILSFDVYVKKQMIEKIIDEIKP